jgi:large subunit ribosomal protein L21
MKYAIIESGGKQIKAVEGSLIDVDLMMGTEIGSEVVLDQVLFVAEDEKFLIGTPVVKGAKVTTTVADHVKGPKLIIFKYQPKKRIRVKTGHRQYYTRLKVETIKAE